MISKQQSLTNRRLTIQYVMPTFAMNMASDRIRVAQIAQQLQARNHRIICRSTLDPTADIYFFSKYGHLNIFFGDPNLAIQARARQKPVVYDICDNYFEFYNPWQDPKFSASWQEAHDRTHQMCQLATHIVCATPYLKNLIKQQNYQKPIWLIPDTYEYLEIPPVTLILNQPRLLWFGHKTNILPLIQFQHQTGDRYPVTAIVNEPKVLLKEIATSGYQCQKLRLMSWNYQLVADQAEKHDLVIIPQLDNAKTRAKGPCRLMTSIRLGCFAIVSPMLAYQEFKDYCYLTDNLEDGIRWATQHPHLAEERVRQGQAYLREHYSPKKIGDKWEEFYQSVCTHMKI